MSSSFASARESGSSHRGRRAPCRRQNSPGAMEADGAAAHALARRSRARPGRRDRVAPTAPAPSRERYFFGTASLMVSCALLTSADPSSLSTGRSSLRSVATWIRFALT